MSLLEQLSAHDAFVGRHIGPQQADLDAMLAVVGASSLDDLTDRIVPAGIRMPAALDLPAPRSEADVLAELKRIAGRNKVYRSFIGQGYYGTITPPVVLRNVLENPAWYTAYTPYQPEISQGRLEALLNFQTLVCELTGMDIANASLLDEATAAAEAMTLAKRSARAKSNAIVVSQDVHPQTLALLQTRAEPLGLEVRIGDLDQLVEQGDFFAALVQTPGSSGRVRTVQALADAVHAKQGLLIVASDLLALTIMTSPGQHGADIVVGSAQRFGVPFGYGGPHAGFLACRDAFKRSMPGRLVGVSVDAQGQPALRLAMQTREQHIRREKATSNICTAQVLLAVMASFYAVWHGPQGLQRIARRCHLMARMFAAGARQLGFSQVSDSYFDTVMLPTEQGAALIAAAQAKQINLRDFGAHGVGVSFDESHTAQDLNDLLAVLAEVAGKPAPDLASLEAAAGGDALGFAAELQRQGPCLTHPIFTSVASETDMLRYIRKLSDKDLALDRAMIPLGSCTMKLNATTEMIPVTWEGFAGVHPLVPADQAEGYKELIDGLCRALVAVTGYDAVSLQPNSGAQGEYAGLLAIRAYHRSRGESQRDVCLIPTSAHGTNPASAQMCNMEVVPVACDARGNVDVEDLKVQIGKYSATPQGNRIAALMITYPSTHGVFEEAVTEICALVHDAGGQVYLDGANLNALVGVAQPGKFGADVSHLNLHKTFCIPHGGGGPGVGPVAVRAHLAPFLPGTPDPSVQQPVGPVSAAMHGSAGILPIPWAYIAMMGASGLKRATQVAMLSANYIARRLQGHYEVLYSGHEGLVAHECILDTRPFKDSCGVSAEDIAKRLIDFGFHAPTMSFPVAGTLMVEPTESESKAELDRFIDAMIAIRDEIRAIEAGELPRDDNPLSNAPHPASVCLASNWQHPYPREQAAYPSAAMRAAKYWAPVARVDNVYGDRNLVCTCPPMSDYVAQ